MVTCLLTQPQPRVAALCEQVRAAGLAAVPLEFTSLELIEGAAAELMSLDFERFDRIVFVSPSAVWFARQAIDRMAKARRPQIAVIGAGTQAALTVQHPGIQPLKPSQPPYDAEHLAAIPDMQLAENQAMLVVRADRGREDWIEQYRRQGVKMTVLALYRALTTDPAPEAVQSLVKLAQADAKALTVVSSVGLADRLLDWRPDPPQNSPTGGQAPIGSWLRRQPVFVAHPRIASRLTDGGFGSTILPSDDQSLLGAAIQWAHENA